MRLSVVHHTEYLNEWSLTPPFSHFWLPATRRAFPTSATWKNFHFYNCYVWEFFR